MILDDSTNVIISKGIFSDSLQKEARICIAPIVAFGFIGALTGGTIGWSVGAPKRISEGKRGLKVSKTGMVGFAIGAIVGGYIGYRLAKRDAIRTRKQNDQLIDCLNNMYLTQSSIRLMIQQIYIDDWQDYTLSGQKINVYKIQLLSLCW